MRARSYTLSMQGVRWGRNLRARSSALSMQGVRWGINLRARSSAQTVQGVRVEQMTSVVNKLATRTLPSSSAGPRARVVRLVLALRRALRRPTTRTDPRVLPPRPYPPVIRRAVLPALAASEHAVHVKVVNLEEQLHQLSRRVLHARLPFLRRRLGRVTRRARRVQVLRQPPEPDPALGGQQVEIAALLHVAPRRSKVISLGHVHEIRVQVEHHARFHVPAVQPMP